MSDWNVPYFFKAPTNSIFDKEFDYYVSLGHRCCVGQALNYMRKSSFPFDWQITDIDVLPNIFKNEFSNFYPDSGVDFAHVIYYPDENGNESNRINHEETNKIYSRRSNRLVKLLKENERRLLLYRHKYVWYWSKAEGNNDRQRDLNPIEHDIHKLIEVSDILKNQYNNDKFDIIYVYQDMSEFETLPYDSNGDVSYDDLELPDGQTQIEEAKKFTYVEQLGFKDHNITPVIVKPGKVRVEGNAMCSCINNFLNLTDLQDFELPYGFEKKKLTRNIDVE